MTGPYWIKQWIADLALLNEQFRDDDGRIDFEALGREEFAFRTALITRKFNKSERAKEIFLKAKELYETNSERGKKGGRPKKINGDADTSDGSDESTTVSNDMPRVGQNGTHPRIQGGDRAAQGAMSPSPSGAAQDGKFRGSAKTQGESNTGITVPAVRPESGNIYDQETCQVSTDEARQSQALVSRRTDGHSLRVGNVARPPVRSRASFRNKEDFIQWAIDDGLDPVDANECWEATEERGGKDADGNTIKNMKAFARQWCRTRANNRRTA